MLKQALLARTATASAILECTLEMLTAPKSVLIDFGVAAIGLVAAVVVFHGTATGAGLRCFDNLSVSSTVRDGQGDTLIDAGYIDVTKAPYDADKTGKADAAPAIQKAIDDGYNMSLAVYVPKGTYLIGSPLVARQVERFQDTCGASNRKHGNIIVGDATGGTFPVLKARDGSFAGKTLMTMLFVGLDGVTPGPAGRHYVSLFRGFTIDMGNNPNGNALSLEGAQLTSIEDVIIRGNFNVGITSLPGSGGSTTNVKVMGGSIGIRQNAYRPTPSLHGVELVNQKRFGIELGSARGGIIVVGFKIQGSGEAGVRIPSRDSGSHPQRNLVMADGTFELSAPAISGSGNAIYLRNVYAKTPTIVSNTGIGGLGGNANAWTKVTEYATTDSAAIVVDGQNHSPHYRGAVSQGSAPPSNLIAIHAWDPAKVPTWFNTETLDIRTYGATPDKHDDDDAPAINRALQDSANQHKPVYIPRGRFNVRQGIFVPAGASMIGSSYTNSIIYGDDSWRPPPGTALMRTENAVGNVFLMDFAVNGHEPAERNGQSWNNAIIFHGQTSNMLLRDVQPNRREWWSNGGQQFKQTVGLFSGNAGGRIYNLAFDFHESGKGAGEHHMFRIEGTTHPLALYQPNTEGADNDPQVMIRNANNVTWYGLKYENTGSDNELLHIIGSENIGILGGSGNYAGSKKFVTMNNSSNLTVTMLARQGTVSGPNIVENGTTRLGSAKKITTFKRGDAKLFGEINPPGFPYPGAPGVGGEDGTTGPGPCHLFTAAQSVPDGFGAAYNLFAPAEELLVNVECGSSTGATLTVGNGQSTTYVYRFGYEWVNGGWKQIALGGSNLTAQDWYVGTAKANLFRSQAQLAEDNFVVAYTCLWLNNSWKCGCRDANCTQSYWQLQAFKK